VKIVLTAAQSDVNSGLWAVAHLLGANHHITDRCCGQDAFSAS
jgi:hypothetical protein